MVLDDKNIMTFSKCNVYKDFNISSGQQVSCPNEWQFDLKGDESTIVNEVTIS